MKPSQNVRRKQEVETTLQSPIAYRFKCTVTQVYDSYRMYRFYQEQS